MSGTLRAGSASFRAWRGSWLALILGGSLNAFALGPHELLLLVNSNSAHSLEVANHYQRQRGIPPQNVVYLGLPDRVLEPAAELSPAEFTQHIWEPAQRIIDQRKLRDHILAWAYSADFPVRIGHNPPVSIQGLTFTRNELPEAELIEKGTYRSPLFAGPDQAGGDKAASRTLEGFTVLLGPKMPLPSMMLGFTGSRGLSVAQVQRCLRYGLASDGSHPRAPIRFIHTDDVRSTCRQWQVDDVLRELQALQVRAEVSTEVAPPSQPVAGLQLGRAWLRDLVSTRFVPGAMAEHLTSFAGYFEHPEQDVLTQWLRAGATASAGTVCEPMAIWTKFPHARFFTHHASGCTMLESFFQAIRCPLQIVLVGDPLARPWAGFPAITLVNLGDEDAALSGKADFLITSWAGINEGRSDHIFLLDGRTVNSAGQVSEFSFETAQLSDGYHELRAVVYGSGPIRQQNFSVQGFVVENRGHRVELAGLPSNGVADVQHPLSLRVLSSGEPRELALVANERILARAPYRPEQTLTFLPSALGPGPVALQAVALYDKNETVRSRPAAIELKPLNQPPVIGEVARVVQDGRTLLRAEGRDPEGDPVHMDWVQTLDLDGDPALTTIDVEGSRTRQNDRWLLSGEAPFGRFVLQAAWPDAPFEFGATVSVPPEDGLMSKQVATLLFNVRDADHFDFFGLLGDDSAWVAGTYERGALQRVIRRGRFIEPSHPYRLAIRVDRDDLVGLVDEEPVLRWPKRGLSTAGFGLMCSPSTAEVGDIFVSPPLKSPALGPSGADLYVVDPEAVVWARLYARARDAFSETRAPCPPTAPAP